MSELHIIHRQQLNTTTVPSRWIDRVRVEITREMAPIYTMGSIPHTSTTIDGYRTGIVGTIWWSNLYQEHAEVGLGHGAWEGVAPFDIITLNADPPGGGLAPMITEAEQSVLEKVFGIHLSGYQPSIANRGSFAFSTFVARSVLPRVIEPGFPPEQHPNEDSWIL